MDRGAGHSPPRKCKRDLAPLFICHMVEWARKVRSPPFLTPGCLWQVGGLVLGSWQWENLHCTLLGQLSKADPFRQGCMKGFMEGVRVGDLTPPMFVSHVAAWVRERCTPQILLSTWGGQKCWPQDQGSSIAVPLHWVQRKEEQALHLT